MHHQEQPFKLRKGNGMRTRIIASAALVALTLTACGGGINSVDEAMQQLETASTDEERQEAIDYLIENQGELEGEAAAPAPVTIEFNEPVDVSDELRDDLGSQFSGDLSEYEGDPRVVRLSAQVTNTSDEPLNIPEFSSGFEVFEGEGQYPVDSFSGYIGYEDITSIERMPTVIQAGESVEFANSFVVTEESNFTVTFNWNGEEGSATATETFDTL